MLRLLLAYRRPLLALVLACALAFLVFAPAPRADAATKTGHDVTCYSDAGRTHVTGYHYYCVGYSGGWGTLCCYCVWNNFPCR